MFDHHLHHHHGRPHRKTLSDESHGSKNLPGAGHAKSQARMLTFDEQLRSLHIASQKKTANVNQSPNGETSSSNHTKKNDEVWKNTIDTSFWKKIKSRYENPNKKKENTNSIDRIVVLKPNHRVVDSTVDLGCRCSYLHTNQTSQQIIKHTHVSFNDVRKKLKSVKKMKSNRKMKKPCEASNGNDSKKEILSIVPFVKHREPDVFVEARRHLAERFRQAEKGEPLGSSSKGDSRTLERILLSSPVHHSMDTFGLERLNPNNVGRTGGYRCIDGSRQEYSLDVSSPKADHKLENDQFRENPSPVSVLDSFFTDNISSPTSTIESVELQIQPHRLDFEEHSSQTSSPPRKIEDRGFISSYINDIYQISQSNWVDFLESDYPLESLCDHKLLHDCVKEVLVSLHARVTFVTSMIRPFSLEKDVVNEVVDQVDWHNGQPVVPRTLDVLVRRDIAKCGNWVDVISDRNDIVFEVVDETLLDLIMEAVSDIAY